MGLILLLALLQATPPRALDGYITNDDYPIEALRYGHQGQVGYVVDVDAAGRITDCRITASANDASLDQATCALIRERAHFRPATDAAGQPVPGSVSGSINWRLNNQTSPYPVGEFIARTVLRVSRSGDADCTVNIFGTVVEHRTEACGDLARSGAVEALRRLRRDAELTFQLEVLRPDMTNSPPPAQGLIEEHEAIFDVAADGTITDCRVTLARAVRPLAGLGPILDLCSYRPPTGNHQFPVLAYRPGPRQERIHSLLWLREDRPRRLR